MMVAILHSKLARLQLGAIVDFGPWSGLELAD